MATNTGDGTKPEQHVWQASWAATFGFGAPLLTLLSIYEIIEVWKTVTGTRTNATPLGFGLHWGLDQDQSFLFLAALGGFAGGLMTTMAKYAWRRSRGTFRVQDASWYWVRTFIGAGLGLTLYAVLKGGLLVLGGSSTDANAHAVLGFSVVAGLFTDRVMSRLRSLATTLFADADGDEDGALRTIVAWEPKQLAQALTGQTVTLHLSPGDAAPRILVDGAERTIAPGKDANAYVVAIGPELVSTPRRLPIAVVDPAGLTSTIDVPIVPA